MHTIEVANRSLNDTTSDLTLPGIVLDLPDEDITVAELIRRTVEEQCRTLLATQHITMQEVCQVLSQQYKVKEQNKTTIQTLPSASPDNTAAVTRALQAFAQRAYLIIIDGKVARSLDEHLTLTPTCKITFIRLTPLIGG